MEHDSFEHAGSPPTGFPSQASTATFEPIRPLYEAAGWLKFIGVVSIIVGILYCISIIGILFGWIPIWIGVLANGASTSLRNGVDRQNTDDVYFAMRRLATITKIIGVLMIINIAVMVVYVFVAIAMITSGGFR